jgi:hypothetical protein
MGEWKTGVNIRIREEMRREMVEFAQRERRSLGNLGAVLLEWSFELLKSAGSTHELMGTTVKRLDKLIRDRRKREREYDDGRMESTNQLESKTRPPT